jgi:uncharacterized protein
MRNLIVLGLVGLAAQLVDGSLGMAYGVTSTTLLLATGLAPASASAAVHLAEIGTTLVSGASHWRFGNVDWPVVLRIAVPGAIGAFAGATVLSSLATDAAAPWMSGILLALGIYILLRFTLNGQRKVELRPSPKTRFLAPLGIFAGFIDSTGGGGWGPVATPALLASGRMEPRKVIGSVDTSEFLVAVAASAGFLIGLGAEQIPLPVVGALLVGGVLAAPLAAWLVRKLPAGILGVAVGGLIILTNVRTLFKAFDVSDTITVWAYSAIVGVWAASIALALRGIIREQRTTSEEAA